MMDTEELIALRGRATNGPWRVDKDKAIVTASKNIAKIWRNWGDAGEATEANAALIALAPDLLDEVIRMRADLAHEVEAHGETQAALREFMADVDRLRAERDALRAREAEAMAFTESAVRTGYINTMRMHNWLQGGAK